MRAGKVRLNGHGWHFHSIAPLRGKQQVFLTYLYVDNYAYMVTKTQFKAAAEPLEMT